LVGRVASAPLLLVVQRPTAARTKMMDFIIIIAICRKL
jgi:hypothetical protein